MRVYHKAYVYLTCGTDLLVFNEPDTPHLGLQVPGVPWILARAF